MSRGANYWSVTLEQLIYSSKSFQVVSSMSEFKEVLNTSFTFSDLSQ